MDGRMFKCPITMAPWDEVQLAKGHKRGNTKDRSPFLYEPRHSCFLDGSLNIPLLRCLPSRVSSCTPVLGCFYCRRHSTHPSPGAVW